MNYLSIDVGGTYTKFGLLDHSGGFIKTWKKPTATSLESFKQMISQQILINQDQIKGIAMSCPGRIDTAKGYIHTGGSLMFLYDFSIGEWIKEITSLPFAIINDGKAAVLAEWWIGHLKGIQYGAAVVLGTGIGGGLILNDQLYQGPHFLAGELSFLLRTGLEDKELESYGRYGSAVRFIEKATALIATTTDDHEAVFTALAKNPQPELLMLFEEYCQNIAILLINLQVSLDLEKIVIGGGISEQQLLIQGINKQYRALRAKKPLLKSTFAPMSIEACAYKNSANLLGALYQLLLALDTKP